MSIYDDVKILLQSHCVSSADLDSFIAGKLPELSADQVYLTRINTVGGLRGEGYIIPRKRGQYQIVGFEEKRELKTADLWPDHQQSILRKFEARPRVLPSSYLQIQQRLRDLGCDEMVPAHQISPGYIISYELANDDGRFLHDGSIVVRKFANQPRFRILLPNMNAWGKEITNVGEQLGTVSRKNVKIMSALPGQDWKLFGWAKDTTRIQGLYRLEELANEEKFLSMLPSRKRTYVRRNLREIFIDSCHHLGPVDWERDATKVVDTWRYGTPGLKQRQLAITRDYAAISLAPLFIKHTSFIAYRHNSVPCGVVVYDPINNIAVGDLVCKGLNYPEMEGGYHNTALAMLHLVAKQLLRQGYQFLNDGGLDGGTEGLYHYKEMIVNSFGGRTMTTQDWYLPNTSYTPDFV